MIRTTNNAKQFFEEEQADATYIYGAGNPGQWVAKFMGRCGMDFDGFVDRAVTTDDCFVLGKRILHPKRLQGFQGKRIKLVIAILNPKEALADLALLDCCSLLCLVPIYKDFIRCDQRYDINKLLSYFRGKLLKGEMPTILSNTCNAGFIYRYLNGTMISPTINTGIPAAWDFIKLCKSPDVYLREDIRFDHWTLFEGERVPVGKVKDIEVLFAHSEDAGQAMRTWNKLRQWVNWAKMIFIMEDIEGFPIPYEAGKEFCALPGKHLLLKRDNLCISPDWNGIIHVEHSNFHVRDSAVENWFDLVGWLNGEAD